MIEESTSPAIAEDMKALNEFDDAMPGAGFSAGWRAALRTQRRKQHNVLRYALPAAAVICYLLGGTALYRGLTAIPARSSAPMLMSVPAPASTAMPSAAEGPVVAFNYEADFEATDLAAFETPDRAAFEAPDQDGGSFEDREVNDSADAPELQSAAEEAKAPTDAYVSYSSAAAEAGRDNGFFDDMKEFILMSWPWAAGALLLIAVITAVMNRRRKAG